MAVHDDSSAANAESLPGLPVAGCRSPGNTLRPADKLKNKSEFDAVKTNGKKFSNRYFTVLIGEPEGSGLKCGVICSRKFHKRAVVRNRARRVIWEAFRLLKKGILPCRIVLIPRREIQTASMNEVMTQLEIVLAKAQRLNISRK